MTRSSLPPARDSLRLKLTRYEELMRLNRFIGVLLLWWPTLAALLLAGRGAPTLYVLWVFALGTVLMRSAGCVINDLVDQKFDRHVKRTMNRPLAQGQISRQEAYVVAAILLLLSAALLHFTLSRSLWLWAFFGVLISAIYPFMKRIIAVPQAVLGIAFSVGIPMAYVELTGGMPRIGWWLVVANILWVLAYDTIYAMVDEEDDRKIGIRSSAIFFGKYAPWAVTLFHFLSLLTLVWLGLMMRGVGLYYFGALVLAGIFALYLHSLIRHHDPQSCLRAFRLSHWFGAILCLGILLQFWVPYLIRCTSITSQLSACF